MPSRNDYVQLDGLNNALLVAALRQHYNGAAWENVLGNQELTVFPAATRSATAISPDFTNANFRGVMVFLNITAASGTGGLTGRVEGKDPVGGGYFALRAARCAGRGRRDGPAGLRALPRRLRRCSLAAHADHPAAHLARAGRAWRCHELYLFGRRKYGGVAISYQPSVDPFVS